MRYILYALVAAAAHSWLYQRAPSSRSPIGVQEKQYALVPGSSFALYARQKKAASGGEEAGSEEPKAAPKKVSKAKQPEAAPVAKAASNPPAAAKKTSSSSLLRKKSTTTATSGSSSDEQPEKKKSKLLRGNKQTTTTPTAIGKKPSGASSAFSLPKGLDDDDFFDENDAMSEADLKELLGDDFLAGLSGGLDGLLPDGLGLDALGNFDLEGDLRALKDEDDPLSEDDLDKALRGLESGEFSMDDFLPPVDGELDEEALNALEDAQTPKNFRRTIIDGGLSEGEMEEVEEEDDEDDMDMDEEDDEDEIDSGSELDLLSTGSIPQRRRSFEQEEDLEIDVIDTGKKSKGKAPKKGIKASSLSEGVEDAELEDVEAAFALGEPKLEKKSSKSKTSALLDEMAELSELVSGNATSSKLSVAGITSSSTSSKSEKGPLVIDGMELDRGDFELGMEPPPLEEFKRLMESLGPDSMFEEEDDTEDLEREYEEFFQQVDSEGRPWYGGQNGSAYWKPPLELWNSGLDVNEETGMIGPSKEDEKWFPSIYEGGRPEKKKLNLSDPSDVYFRNWLNAGHLPDEHRCVIVSVINNNPKNQTALEMVNKIYDYIRAGTNNDSRIGYQIITFEYMSGRPLEELDDMVQMWAEGYNTYHLVDGFAMREAWGAIMPHIMLSEKNLNAIVDQVKWTLSEDELNGAILTPRLRTVRFRGGAGSMTTGYNTEMVDSEFSVVSVR